MKKKMMMVVVGLVAVVASGLLYLTFFPAGQRPDSAFDLTVRNPAYTDRHPLILFDEGHYNSHTSDGGYAPFAKLMRNDGFQVSPNTTAFTSDTLRQSDVLVIVNAAGGSNPKLFGINLVPLRTGQREGPAFTDAEVEAVRSWVEGGGSLLLVADHHPFGSAAAALSAAFGTRMHGGLTEAPNQDQGQSEPGSIRFSRENGLLGEHAITMGRSPGERINEVLSFTGQSLDCPPGMALMRLPPSAVEYVPPEFNRQPSGSAQGCAFEYGSGRVVVLGEAATLTAQINDDGQLFGMNVPGVDNRQFALNVMRWLSRLL